MELMGGSATRVLRAGPPDDRDAAGETLARFMFRPLWRHGLLYADPHPGNYRFLGACRVAFLDFGCHKQHRRLICGRDEALRHGAPGGRPATSSTGLRRRPGLRSDDPESFALFTEYTKLVLQPLVVDGHTNDERVRATRAWRSSFAVEKRSCSSRRGFADGCPPRIQHAERFDVRQSTPMGLRQRAGGPGGRGELARDRASRGCIALDADPVGMILATRRAGRGSASPATLFHEEASAALSCEWHDGGGGAEPRPAGADLHGWLRATTPPAAYGDACADNILIHGENLDAMQRLGRRGFRGPFPMRVLRPSVQLGPTLRRIQRTRWPPRHGEARLSTDSRPRVSSRGGRLILRRDRRHRARPASPDTGRLVWSRRTGSPRSRSVRSAATGHKAVNRGPVNVTDYLLVYAKTRRAWRLQRARARAGPVRRRILHAGSRIRKTCPSSGVSRRSWPPFAALSGASRAARTSRCMPSLTRTMSSVSRSRATTQ